MANIERLMANIEPAMAKIEIAMADITSRYGGNYLGMAEIVWIWRKLFRASRTGISGIALKSEAGRNLC